MQSRPLKNYTLATNQSVIESATVSMQNILSVTLPILSVGVIAACIANGLICWIIWNKRQLHTPTFYLVFNMAVSDCILLVSALLIISLDYVLISAKLNQYSLCILVLCKVLLCLNTTAYVSSTFTLASISIERYYTLFSNYRGGSFFNTKLKLVLAISLSWLLGFAISWPFILVMLVPRKFPWICAADNFKAIFSPLYFVTLSLIAYILPLAIVIMVYTKIILYLKQYLKHNKLPNASLQRKRHTRIVKMLVILTCFFFILSLPQYLIFLIMAFSRKSATDFLTTNNPRNAIMVEIVFLFNIVSCLQNSILYFYYNPMARPSVPCKCSYRCMIRRQVNTVNTITP